MHTRTTLSIVAIVVIAALVLAAAALSWYRRGASEEPIQMTWLVAHEPVSLFDRPREVFLEEFRKHSSTPIDVKIIGPRDLGYTSGRVPSDVVLQKLSDGDAQVAALVASALSKNDPDLSVVLMPFAFASYAEAESYLNGPQGTALLESVGRAYPVRANAFAFSGGFTVIASNNKAIRTFEDMRGLRIATISGPVTEDTLTSFGATPVQLNYTEGVSENNKRLDEFDGIEQPYSRFYPDQGDAPKYINETKFTLFLTAIISDKKFYESLSTQDRAAFDVAVKAAAQAERNDSIALNQKKRDTMQANGTQIIEMTDVQRKTFEASARSVYKKYAPSLEAAAKNGAVSPSPLAN